MVISGRRSCPIIIGISSSSSPTVFVSTSAPTHFTISPSFSISITSAAPALIIPSSSTWRRVVVALVVVFSISSVSTTTSATISCTVNSGYFKCRNKDLFLFRRNLNSEINCSHRKALTIYLSRATSAGGFDRWESGFESFSSKYGALPPPRLPPRLLVEVPLSWPLLPPRSFL